MNDDDGDLKRPDISIFNPPEGGFPKVLLDVGIACPLEGSGTGKIVAPSNDNAQVKMWLGSKKFDDKNRTYLQRAQSVGCGFMPIVFMSTGALHVKSKKFLFKLAKHASGSGVVKLPVRTIYSFMLRSLSVALQKGVARSINQRVLMMNSQNLPMALRGNEHNFGA